MHFTGEGHAEGSTAALTAGPGEMMQGCFRAVALIKFVKSTLNKSK